MTGETRYTETALCAGQIFAGEIRAPGGDSLYIALKKSSDYAGRLTVKVRLWPNRPGEQCYTAIDTHVTESQLGDYTEKFDDMAWDWAEEMVEAGWTPVGL